jgi:hypothetical protein
VPQLLRCKVAAPSSTGESYHRIATTKNNRRSKMTLKSKLTLLAASTVIGTLAACSMQPTAPANSLSFFVTSTNPGKGADLGGLAGADAFCESLASKVGAGGKQWRAYLSAAAAGSAPAVNAKDRIGTGPWTNAKGVVIAKSIAELYGENQLNKQTALTEAGAIVSGRGDPVNVHDILTGSNADGTLATSAPDTTCGNWTKSGAGSAFVGHHDRIGLNDSAPMKSWNASHGSRGCDMESLKASGGGGLFYCFAAK